MSDINLSDWEVAGSGNEDNNLPSDNKISDLNDWEVVQNDNKSHKSIPYHESFGKSVAYAIPRIVNDIGIGAYHALQKIPEMYRSAKESPAFMNIPGLINTLYNNPGHASLQGIAGANEAINSLAQTPLNIARYGSNRLNLLPQPVTNAISSITPEDTTKSINYLFGKPKYTGEETLRSGIRNIPSLYGAGKVISAMDIPSYFATKKGIKNSILKTHDELENRASHGFNTVLDEVNNRGITKVPIDNNFIESLREYFPRTRSSNSLIDNARSGDFNSLRKLQSDLYTKAKKNLGSDLESDRSRGAEMFEKRNDINDEISNHLKNTGNYDLDNILNSARGDYKILQNIYYNENMSPSIIKMVDKKFRKVPNNLVKILQEESNPMNQLIEFHPGLKNQINHYFKSRNALNKIKNISKYGLLPAAGAYGGIEYANRNKNSSS